MFFFGGDPPTRMSSRAASYAQAYPLSHLRWPGLGERHEELGKVLGCGSIAEQRTHAEDLLHGSQQGAVRPAGAAGESFPGERREHDHADRSVAGAFALVPGDEQRPALLPPLPCENARDPEREPRIACA